MTLRSIDTQLSLSRTMDVGNVQNQLMHKPSDDLLSAATQAAKQHEEERMRSNQVDKTAESKIRDGSQHGGNRYRGKQAMRSKDEHEEENGKSEHPYKGKFIDYSL